MWILTPDNAKGNWNVCQLARQQLHGHRNNHWWAQASPNGHKKSPGLPLKKQGNHQKHAVQQLHRHFFKCHCSNGATETISVENYSISYMLGSVSSLARQLHPNGRNEGPLHYCLFNNMTEKIVWNSDTQTGEQDASYLINAYIHLLEGHKRCEVVIQKAL